MTVHIGMTPRYLDSRCHEALYEVDMGVYGVHERSNEDDTGFTEGGRDEFPIEGDRRRRGESILPGQVRA
jgi:hypothetical protein